MTKRDEPALKVSHDSHDSSESNERQSVTRPISSVRAKDELSPQQEQRSASECREAVASSTEDSSRDRPTLMGLAPVDPEDEADHASGSHIPHERTSGEPETSTVQPASWLAADAEQAEAHDAHNDADDDATESDDEQDDADDDEAEEAYEGDDDADSDDADSDDDEADEADDDEADDDEADDDESDDDEADEGDDPDDESGQETAPELTESQNADTVAQHVALASSGVPAPAYDDHEAPQGEPAGAGPNANAQHRAPMQISMFMPAPDHANQPDHARLPEEGESEWLDLSTRWLVTSGPRPVPDTEQPIVDENEITDAYWAERLSARVAPRADTQSSAPPPPPQAPRQSTELHGVRRASRRSRPTIGYDLPTGPAGHEPQAVPPAFDAAGQRQWAPSPRRHETLAGISPLPEDPSQWPPHTANDGARSGKHSAEPNPWREEPSYSDAPLPQAHGARAHRPSTMAASYAAPAGTIPPWAAPMSPYAMQPPAAMMPAYAPTSWNGGVTLPPPWAAQPNYGMPAQHLQPPATYAPSERRATRTMDYALPPAAGPATANRNMRAPQHPTNEISFEQWKGIANTWFMTVGKLALAGMALHFSGLAKPLLANFGYAPAQAASVEPAVRAPVPAAASIAAASIIPEGLSPESSEEPAPRRTPPAKREPTVASETTEAPARRHSYKSAHKAKPKPHAKRSAATEAPATTPQPVAAPQPAAPAVSAASAPQAAPLAAAAPAAPAAEEAVGEALLRINSRPWSEIFVDGTHVGHTPKLDLRVSAGSHSIRLVNRDLNLTKTFEVDLAAGETVSHVELFID